MNTQRILIPFLIFIAISCKWDNPEKETPETIISETHSANEEMLNIQDSIRAVVPLFLTDALQYNLAKIDNELSAIYDALAVGSYPNTEKYLPLFKTRLIKHLKNKLTFDQPLDSLSKRIKINSLSGINIYSFDDMTGGSMLYEVSYLQYKDFDNAVKVEELSDEGLITDAWPFIFRGENYFLLLSHYNLWK